MTFSKVLFLDTAQATDKVLASGYAHFILQEPFGGILGCQIACSQFSFTNWFINISAALGNNKLYYSNDILLPMKFTITIPDGSYSFNDLNAFIKAELISQNNGGTPGLPIFSLVANYATNKVGIQFSATDINWYVHFDADSPFVLMGFTVLQDIPVTLANTAYYLEMGPNIAQFNNITNIKVVTNLSNDSISNTNQSAVILTCTPTVSVGSTQQFEVQNLLWLRSTPLEDKVTEIKINILDQLDRPVNLSEDVTMTLIVKN